MVSAAPIGVETLDDPAADPVVVRRMLADIARANRWLGGHAAVLRGLDALLEPGDAGRTLTLLDLGTGAGDLPLAAREAMAARGITLRLLGVERHRAAAAMARDAGVPTIVACGTRIPMRDADLVLCSQLLHHFGDDDAVAMLAEATRVARRGVVVADLRPSTLAARGFRVAGRLLGLARVTIDDGVTSLARGREASHLVALGEAAGLVPVLARDLSLGRVVVAFRPAAR